jgi:hypothetical protein
MTSPLPGTYVYTDKDFNQVRVRVLGEAYLDGRCYAVVRVPHQYEFQLVDVRDFDSEQHVTVTVKMYERVVPRERQPVEVKPASPISNLKKLVKVKE